MNCSRKNMSQAKGFTRQIKLKIVPTSQMTQGTRRPYSEVEVKAEAEVKK